jgi:hypothetical protein
MKTTRSVLMAVCVLAVVAAGVGCSEETVCEVLESRTVSLDEELVDGFSAQEILDMTGPQEAELTWLLSPNGSNPTNAEANSSTTISIAIASHGNEATYTRTRQTGTNEIDLNCGETMTIPVSLRVVTEDGALDETFDSVLLYGAGGPSGVWSKTSFDFDSLVGWLRPNLTGVTGDVQGEFYVEFEGGERGWVGVVETRTNDGNAEERWEFAGRWGSI